MNPDLSKESFSVVIPASGFSVRMGRSKVLLEWGDGMTFLEKIIQTYTEAGCRKIICTLNPATLPMVQNLNRISTVHLVLNPYPERGRMYSLKLGLGNALDSPYCFIQNVDNPFVTVETIRNLFRERDPDTWISPEFRGRGGHPVLLPKKLVQRVTGEYDQELTLHDILRNFPKKSVKIQDASVLRNINTPDDYQEFLNQPFSLQNGNSSHQ